MNTATSAFIETKSETEILNFLLNHALENDLPIAFWRLPDSSIRYLVISQQYKTLDKNSPIEDLPQGFMLAPFDRDKERLFLPGDFIFRFENNSLLQAQNPAETTSANWLSDKLMSEPKVN